MRRCIASAAATASRACAGLATGAPQNAMIASPMYLSTVPRSSWITSVSAVRYTFIISESARGDRCSEIAVKLRTSENSTVSSRSRLRARSAVRSSRICATRSRGTYSPNMSDSAPDRARLAQEAGQQREQQEREQHDERGRERDHRVLVTPEPQVRARSPRRRARRCAMTVENGRFHGMAKTPSSPASAMISASVSGAPGGTRRGRR